MSLNEFQLISKYFKSDYSDKDILLGIGDDTALLQIPEGHNLAVSSDTLVESVHFPKGAPADLLARRALRVNLSDMAAMGAQPRWFTLALTLSETDEDWLSQFSSALHEDANQFGCSLVGGDTTRGSLNIGIQIMGTIGESHSGLRRSGAKAGDLLVVTGTLGDAAAAIDYLTEQSPSADAKHLLNRYWLPEPRVEFALQASELINAACDISDGLAGDVGHICKASGLGVKIEIDKLPLSESIKTACGSTAREKALCGGDDYELCMAVAPEHMQALSAVSEKVGVPITVVGEFNSKGYVSCVDSQDQELDIEKSGYKHF